VGLYLHKFNKADKNVSIHMSFNLSFQNVYMFNLPERVHWVTLIHLLVVIVLAFLLVIALVLPGVGWPRLYIPGKE